MFIFIVIWIIYALIISLITKNALKRTVYKFKEISYEDIPEEHKPFFRDDFSKWNIGLIYFGAIFLFPFRLVVSLWCIFSYCLVAFLCELFRMKMSLKRKIMLASGSLLGRILLYCLGILWIHKKYVSIKDYVPDYTPKRTSYESLSNPAPIMICNHASFLDILYFIHSKFSPSYVSKAEVKTVPFVGYIAMALNTLFVDRGASTSKNDILNAITNRVNNWNPEVGSPLLIYPEGTTSACSHLIQFKKGAFYNLQPTKIMCLKYAKGCFSPIMDVLGTTYTAFFTLCNPNNYFEVIEVTEVVDKSIVGKDSDSVTWEEYARVIKNVMMKILCQKNSESTFEHSKKFTLNLKNGDYVKKEKVKKD